MQTNRKQAGILIVLLGLLIILLIIYFGFIKSKTPTTNQPTTGTPTSTAQLPSGPTTGTTTPGDTPQNHQQYDLSKEAPHQLNGNDLSKIGMAFAARFGSYSNQSNYNNFTDLKIMMTDSLKTWVDSYVAALKANAQNSATYYGINTKAITADIANFDYSAGTGKIIVTTERSESTDKIGGGTPYEQKLDLTFKKVGGDWLVDNAYWEKK